MKFNPPTKNIGGGLLCSFGHDTFDLVPFSPHHVGQVVPKEAEDTYTAILVRDGAPPIDLASHPNGHSCKELLDRMAKGNAERALNQFDYILACGGTAMERGAFEALLAEIHG